VNIFGGVLVNSFPISFIKLLIVLFAMLCLYSSISFLKDKNILRYEYSILLGFSVVGMLFLVSSNDFISLYLAMELQGLSTYILAGYYTRSAFSTEAGLKYFIVGSFSSGIYLLGVAFLYLSLGTIAFNDIYILYEALSLNFIVYFGFALIISSLAFKVGAAPFHMYVPDVYEGSLSSVSTFFAVVSKMGVLFLLVRLLFLFSSSFFSFLQPIFFFLGVSSLFFGVFGAL